MVNRVYTPDKKIGADGLPLTVLPNGYVLKNTYTVSYLSAGGMGIVYKAEGQGKRFIVKEVDGKDSRQVIALNQEKATLERLEHPGIVKVLELFEETGYFYLVLEYIEGDNLLKKIPKSTTVFLSEKVVLDWAAQLFDIFDYLHKQNPPIIYRDLKPHNIILDQYGEIKLIDFGIARVYKKEKQEDTQLMGSAITASPEHYGEGQTDVRSDIYTIGATLYFLLTNNMAKREELFKYPPIRSINPKVSEKTERVIMKALSMKPEDRYQTIMEMREALLGPQKSEAQGAMPHSLLSLKTEGKPAKIKETSPITSPMQKPESPLQGEKTAEMKVFCPKCGEKNLTDSSFCEFCGFSLKRKKPQKEEATWSITTSPKPDVAPAIPSPKPVPEVESIVKTPQAKINLNGEITSESTTFLPFTKTGKAKEHKSLVTAFKKTKIILPLLVAVCMLIGLFVAVIAIQKIKNYLISRRNPKATITIPNPALTPTLVFSPGATSVLSSPTESVVDDFGTEKLIREAKQLISEDNYKIAEEKCQEILRLDPHYLEAYWYLGQCYEKKNCNDEALTAYKKYVKTIPGKTDRVRYIAGLLKETRDYKTAIKLETAALKQEETAEVYYSLGQCYFEIKDYNNAVKYLKLATKKDYNNYYYHILLGQASIQSGQKSEAINAYKRAVEIEPDKTLLLYQIGILANETGDYKTSKDYLIRYLSVVNDPAVRKEAEKLLKKVKINAMKNIPPSVTRQTDFINGVQVIGIMIQGASRKAFLLINGYQEEVTEGQMILDKYAVLSIRENCIVLGDPETETYTVLRTL